MVAVHESTDRTSSRRSAVFTRLLAGVLLPVCAIAQDDGVEKVQKYSNRDYGISVTFPRPTTICSTPPPGSNHGFVMPLAGQDCSEGVAEGRRMEFFIRYETVSDAKSAADLAPNECEGQPAAKASKISAGVPVLACPALRQAGLSRFRYFGLRHDGEIGIVFTWDLYTTESSASIDLRTLEKLLGKTKWMGRQ